MRAESEAGIREAGLTSRLRTAGVILLTCAFCLGSPLLAADYPSRPIRIVVPQSPGGTTDLTGRLVAARLADRLGHPVVVDNRPGAGSLHGIDLVAKSTPDGHTLLVVASSLTIIPNMYRKVPYDPVRDLTPVTMLSSYPNVVVTHPAVPAASIRELIALAKAKPGMLNYASGGTGTGTQLTAELFKIMAGIDMVHIPYKGGGPALTALMSGEVQVYFAALPSTLGMLKTAKIRPLAVTSKRRSPALRDVPAVAETSGLEGYDEITWNGLLAPARTPPAIVRKLHGETEAVLKLAATRERFAADGSEAAGNRPEEFGAIIKSELGKWARVISEAGIQRE